MRERIGGSRRRRRLRPREEHGLRGDGRRLHAGAARRRARRGGRHRARRLARPLRRRDRGDRAAMGVPADRILAWLGPAIGPRSTRSARTCAPPFSRATRSGVGVRADAAGHWLLDLYAVARQRLPRGRDAGLRRGGFCTLREPARFSSYRRDKTRERMAARSGWPRIPAPMTLAWIVAASIAGGALSVCAAALALFLRAAWVQSLVSFAIGALLGAAFLEVIPHAFENGEPHGVAARSSAASSVSSCWRSWCCGGTPTTAMTLAVKAAARGAHHHAATTAARGLLIVVGDTFHNFVDGILIAAAFLQSTQLGIITALAIVAHEIPQEVGDFVILLTRAIRRPRRSASTCCPRSRRWSAACSATTRCRRWTAGRRPARHRRGEHDLRRGRRPDPRPAPAAGAARHRFADAADRRWGSAPSRLRGSLIGDCVDAS